MPRKLFCGFPNHQSFFRSALELVLSPSLTCIRVFTFTLFAAAKNTRRLAFVCAVNGDKHAEDEHRQLGRDEKL